MKILYVDSNDCAGQVEASLTRNGHQVTPVDGVLSAMNQLGLESYDCVITEADVGEFDGTEVVSFAQYVGVPVVIYTDSTRLGESDVTPGDPAEIRMNGCPVVVGKEGTPVGKLPTILAQIEAYWSGAKIPAI